VSPLPDGVTHAVKVFRPRHDVRRVAELICERAWKGLGVRVFRWPCGTLAVVTVGSLGDGVLLRECTDQLLVTYARHGLLGGGVPGDGPRWVDVLHDLNWARAA
jgi:hypothetical protein